MLKVKDGLGLGYGVVIYGEDLDWGTPSDFGSNNFILLKIAHLIFIGIQ